MEMELVVLATFAATIFSAVIRASTPVLFAALGGLISDLAGSINVALDGLMLIAAFFGAIVSAYAAIWFPGLPVLVYPFVGCAVGILSAVLLSLVLAVFHLEFGADLIVAGVAINILASGLTVLLLVAFTGDKGSTVGVATFALPAIQIPGVNSIPVLGTILNGDGGRGHHILVYVAFLCVPLVYVLLYKTAFGLRLRSVGEAPHAAVQAGVSARRVQYAAIALSGLFAGLGGTFLSMGYLTLFQADMTAGRGYLGLAAIFLGGRRPFGTMVASVCFGAFTVFAAQLGAFAIPSQIILMIPPIITIVALVSIDLRRSTVERRRIRAAAIELRERPTKMIGHEASATI